MKLIQAYARAQFRPPGEFLVGFRSKLKTAALRAQEVAYEEARTLVPVRSGELRDSIQKDPPTDDGDRITATISATAPHAAFLEFGTGRRGAASPGADLRHVYTLSWPGMGAQPYLRPALDSARSQILAEFGR